MKPRPPSSLLALALALVLSFALGGASVASAGGLTSQAVKKIAKKVVKKQAGSLSVAHAASATRLDSFSADQLRTTGYTYVLPTQAPANERRWHFPGLPNGTYQMTYSLAATLSVPNEILQCQFEATDGPPYTAATYGVTGANPLVQRDASAGIVTTVATSSLDCSATAGTMTLVGPDTQDNIVTFVPVDLPHRLAAGS